MIGFAAATGTVTLESALLFAIIFLWTSPAQLGARGCFRSDDYAPPPRLPMLPVVAGTGRRTRTQILAYTLILVPVGLLPALLGFAGAGLRARGS